MEGFVQIYTEKKRKSLIKTEKKKLEIIYSKLDESVAKSTEKLLNDAAFMAVTLDELRQIIQRDGPVEQYQNGENQKGLKKSAAVEAYDKMVNTYAKVIKQLVDMLPKVIRLQKNENGEETVEEIDEDTAENLLAYVKGFKR